MDKYEVAKELIDIIISSTIGDLIDKLGPGADESIEVKDAIISGRREREESE